MPKGPGAAEPKSHEPWRQYLMEAVRRGYQPFTAGPYKTRDIAKEAVRGFFRAGIGGSQCSLRNEGVDLSLRCDIEEHYVPVSYRRKGQLGTWDVRVQVFTRGQAMEYGRAHPRGERYPS